MTKHNFGSDFDDDLDSYITAKVESEQRIMAAMPDARIPKPGPDDFCRRCLGSGKEKDLPWCSACRGTGCKVILFTPGVY